MTEPFGIALIGCGTVGGGVARLLLEQAPRLTERAGRPLELRRVVVRDVGKPRPAGLPAGVVSADLQQVYGDPNVHVGVELIGGLEPARTIILALLEAGKHVVTANKAVIATHGSELFAAAQRAGRTIAFEASVGGGIPIVAALSQGLAANRIQSIKAILNGTSNFILTQMTEQGESYAEALAEAQRRGYAETDPTLDVDGTDAAHKLAVLARIAFGLDVPPDAIERRGIADIQLADVRFAGELGEVGYVIKLLAEAWANDWANDWASGHQVALHVEPTLLKRLDPLAQVRGAYNAVHVVGDAVGDTLYYGQGAGMMPTASAVVADLIDLAVGRATHTFRTLRLWETRPQVRLRDAAGIRSRFYLRINVADRPGVLAEVAGVLGKHQISIASVIQHEALQEHAENTVPVVIMTHTAAIGDFRQAVAVIDRLGCITSPSVYYPVAE